MRLLKNISFAPLVCALGIVAVVAMVPSFVSASHDDDAERFSTACVSFGNVVPTGKQITFAAGQFGGEGDVTYRWLGAVEGEGQFQRPVFATPGPKLITVVATDEDGRIATAGCPVIASATITSPIFANLATYPVTGGTGGAPGDGGAPVTPPSTGGVGVNVPSDGDGADVDEDEDDGDLTDDEVVDLAGQDGSNAGRIVLWVLIVLIIISLGVLFWQRYYENGEDSGTEKKENKEKKDRSPPQETKKDTNKEDKGSPQDDGGGQVIIPPAR